MHDMQSRWRASERILCILRSVMPSHTEINAEAIERWYREVEGHTWMERSQVESPSLWFHLRFPLQSARFGNAFLEEKTEYGQCRPLFCNTDFLGSVLGGEKALGHQVVFVPAENLFYFWDPILQAFCPTTAAKVQLLASNYLIRCAEAFSNKVTMLPLLDDFRRAPVLQGIVNKAKVILSADTSFFSGLQGKVRCIDGHLVKPASEPPHRLFLCEVMARQPGAFLTVTDAFRHYSQFCRTNHLPTLRMVDFKNEVSATIHEAFNLRPRHDIPGEDGKATHGWRDLACTFE